MYRYTTVCCKSTHLECAQLTEVPEGDWICSGCVEDNEDEDAPDGSSDDEEEEVFCCDGLSAN